MANIQTNKAQINKKRWDIQKRNRSISQELENSEKKQVKNSTIKLKVQKLKKTKVKTLIK